MKEPLVLKNRLKEARAERGLSQTQLAEMVGVSRNTLLCKTIRTIRTEERSRVCCTRSSRTCSTSDCCGAREPARPDLRRMWHEQRKHKLHPDLGAPILLGGDHLTVITEDG